VRNVVSSLRIDWKGLVAELRQLGDVDPSTFLGEAGFELDDIYRRRHGGWSGLRRMADLDDRPAAPEDDKLAGAIGRLLHVDDLERLSFIAEFLGQPEAPAAADCPGRAGRLLAMLHFSLWGWNEPLDQLDAGLQRLWANPARREELLDLAGALRERVPRITRPASPAGDSPSTSTPGTAWLSFSPDSACPTPRPRVARA